MLLDLFWRRNLFLVALDGDGHWYRFHHLFRSLLRHQLERTASKAAIAGLYASASHWCEAQGSVEEALWYSLTAGDEVRAARIVEHNVHTLLNREEWRRLEQWLALLPDAVKQRPALLVASAWLEHFCYRFASIPTLLESAR